MSLCDQFFKVSDVFENFRPNVKFCQNYQLKSEISDQFTVMSKTMFERGKSMHQLFRIKVRRKLEEFSEISVKYSSFKYNKFCLCFSCTY